MTAPILVTSAAELDKICDRLVLEPMVAVDTEFLWERTYYPILGLVQVADAKGNCWLIDPVAIGDIRAFGKVVAAPGVVKILHDAPQDLNIIHYATGAFPKTVFDTRRAAGFAGLSGVCSLKFLAETLLGVTLEKSETRSNWTKRPLTDKQLEYAADDVIYLPEIMERLTGLCKNDEVRAWLAEEMKTLDNESIYQERPVSEAVYKVKGRSHLEPCQFSVLAQLAAWREKAARERNLPRGFIIPDATLLEAAAKPPKNAAELLAINGMPRHFAAHRSREILAAIRAGLENPMPPPERKNNPPYQEIKRKADAILAKIAQRSKEYGIDPQVVAARHDVEDWVNATPEERSRSILETTWRKKLMNG